MSAALAAADARRAERDPAVTPDSPGFYLDFEIPAGSQNAAELLEYRRKHIELVAFRHESDALPAIATLFVPDAAADHFLKKIEEYRTENAKPRKPKKDAPITDENTNSGRPKYEELIARIQNVALAAVRSVYTDDPALFPPAGHQIWWEVWIRQRHIEAFNSVIHHFGIFAQPQRLSFPDRDVRLVFGDEMTIGRLFLNSDAIAEVRRAKDISALFMEWSNVEQAVWSADLAGRLVIPEGLDVAVCVLDTGATRTHPLLSPALDPSDVHAYQPGPAEMSTDMGRKWLAQRSMGT